MKGRSFYVHSKLATGNSEALGALISGSFREGEQGYAVLEDVTPDTFARCLEWMYQGFYTAPPPIAITKDEKQETSNSNDEPPTPDALPPPEEAPQFDFSWGGQTTKKASKKKTGSAKPGFGWSGEEYYEFQSQQTPQANSTKTLKIVHPQPEIS